MQEGKFRQGFDALFAKTSDVYEEKTEEKDEVRLIKTGLIEPRKDQPRKNFDREQLQALANSVAEHGIIQPIIVTHGKNGYFDIIAGERRWRAAKLAGLKEIPAIVRSYDERKVAEVALIENLQREDLNPIEEALGYKTLMEKFEMTQDKVSERVGKSRSSIANMLRLLSLENEIKDMLIENKITMGHARALLSMPGGSKRVEAAKKISEEGFNVRQVEALVKNDAIPVKKAKKSKESAYPDLEQNLSERYGTKIRVKGKNKGKIEIEYYSAADLTRIVDILQKNDL